MSSWEKALGQIGIYIAGLIFGWVLYDIIIIRRSKHKPKVSTAPIYFVNEHEKPLYEWSIQRQDWVNIKTGKPMTEEKEK